RSTNMVTRRRFLQGAVTAALLGRIEPRAAWAEARASGEDAADANSASTASRYVNVFVGTGGHGHTYPGATVPWGMVQLSPDTNDFDWDACSGYHQADGSIMGFSHTHLSGTGASDMLDVLVMPTQGPVLLNPGARGLPDELYYSRYDAAANEKHLAPDVVAHPGTRCQVTTRCISPATTSLRSSRQPRVSGCIATRSTRKARRILWSTSRTAITTRPRCRARCPMPP